MKFIIISLVVLSLILSSSISTQSFAHHKDGHDKGPPDDKGKPDDVPKGPKDKSVVSGAGGCVRMWITNDPTAYARCTIIDTELPIIQQTITKNKLCVKATDNTGINKVYAIFISGAVELYHHNGSYSWYCNFVDLDVVYILAEDIAGNRGILLL
jgi:hypothetical protein